MIKSKTYNADCLDMMRQWPDNKFDLTVSDPPYFSGPEKRGYYGKKISGHGVKRIDYPISTRWEIPTNDFFQQTKRVSKNWIIWGYNYFEFCHTGPFQTPRRTRIIDFVNNNPRGWIIWDKCNGNSSFNDYELAYTSFDRPTIFFTFLWKGMMQGKSIKEGSTMQGNKALNEPKIHPTQKPVALYKWIYLNYTTPGMTILDTHLGSGSSRIAAYDAGLEFTGIEIDPVHFLNQEDRYRLHTAQLLLQFA